MIHRSKWLVTDILTIPKGQVQYWWSYGGFCRRDNFDKYTRYLVWLTVADFNLKLYVIWHNTIQNMYTSGMVQDFSKLHGYCDGSGGFRDCAVEQWVMLLAKVICVCQNYKLLKLDFFKLELPSHKGPNTCRCSGIGWNLKNLDLTICLEWISEQFCQGAKSQKWLWKPQYAKPFLPVILVVYLLLHLLYWPAAIFICVWNY
jgi:hypothetical protein